MVQLFFSVGGGENGESHVPVHKYHKRDGVTRFMDVDKCKNYKGILLTL